MLAIAGAAFALGGRVLQGFVALIGIGIGWEWLQLVWRFAHGAVLRAIWLVAGVLYIGGAVAFAILASAQREQLLAVILAVIAVDVGAYFAGRTFGGPRIAPAISPSKTWSGLGGACFAASVMVLGLAYVQSGLWIGAWALVIGVVVAIVAQAGDFFESWMKRRAGVKDSGSLIPGHGGLFDRADGLIAVLFVIGVFAVVSGSLDAGSATYPVKGGAAPQVSALGERPHPNPSPEGEGLHRVSGVHLRMFVISVAR